MMCERKETLVYLLDRDADPNATAQNGWNALQIFTRNSPLEFLKLRHTRGAHIPVEAGEESALHHATYFGHFESVKYLLEKQCRSKHQRGWRNGPTSSPRRTAWAIENTAITSLVRSKS
jgi:ankyrin repeat protein